MHTVLLVDDQPEFLDLARAMLSVHPALSVVGEAQSCGQALELVPDLNPNVAIVDVQMPRMSGFEAVRRLLDASPTLRVILVSAYSDPQYLPLAHSVGAIGFLHKRAFSADAIVSLLAEN